jgi:alpha-1,2-mannosyltransferase
MSASAVSSTSLCQLDRLARRFAGWVNWRRARAYSLGLCVVYITIWGASILGGQPPLTASNEPIGGDYIAFYAAGQLIAQGHPELIYDRAAIEAVQAAAIDRGIPAFYDAYRNPPFFALIFVPLAWLDLGPSFAVWTAISLALLIVALWLGRATIPATTRRGVYLHELVIVAIAFPAVYFCLIDGQNSTLSLLLYVLIYRALRSGDDGRSGMVAALGLFKPQLFFLFPVLFVVARRWRALAAYGLTACLLIGVSVWLVGPDGISDWLRTLLNYETGNAARNGWRMNSISTFFAQLVPGQDFASLLVTLVLGAVLLAALFIVWRRPGAVYLTAAGWSLTVLVAALVDPHLVDYDLSVLVAVGLLILAPMSRMRLLVVLLYPLLLTRSQIPIASGTLQPATLLILFAALVMYQRCRQLAALEQGPGRLDAQCR